MSQPIPIAGSHHGRARSASESSESSAGTPPPQTPPRRLNATLPRIAPSAGGPGTSPTSPILSYFLGGPVPPASVKSPTAFPFARNPNPFCQTVDDDEAEVAPAAKHARRASTAGVTAGRFGLPTVSPSQLQNHQQERGTGVLRRLSLSGAFGRPQMGQAIPAPTVKKATTPPPIMEAGARCQPVRDGSPRGQRRRATLGVAAPPPRAPSPMGERILKGHFDGFN